MFLLLNAAFSVKMGTVKHFKMSLVSIVRSTSTFQNYIPYKSPQWEPWVEVNYEEYKMVYTILFVAPTTSKHQKENGFLLTFYHLE